jgi:hypothetical protein
LKRRVHTAALSDPAAAVAVAAGATVARAGHATRGKIAEGPTECLYMSERKALHEREKGQ